MYFWLKPKGFRGETLNITDGGSATIRMKRVQVSHSSELVNLSLFFCTDPGPI